jgi:adenosylcobinamide-GDP ribazoletransferase
VIILVLLFLYSHEYAFNALIAFLLSLCTGMLVLLISRKRLGGVTGDVLGAVEVLTETAAMLGFLLPLATQAISR